MEPLDPVFVDLETRSNATSLDDRDLYLDTVEITVACFRRGNTRWTYRNPRWVPAGNGDEELTPPEWVYDAPWAAFNAFGFDALVWERLGVRQPSLWYDVMLISRLGGYGGGLDIVAERVAQDLGVKLPPKRKVVEERAREVFQAGRPLPLGLSRVFVRYCETDVDLMPPIWETCWPLVTPLELLVQAAHADTNRFGVRVDLEKVRQLQAEWRRLADAYDLENAPTPTALADLIEEAGITLPTTPKGKRSVARGTLLLLREDPRLPVQAVKQRLLDGACTFTQAKLAKLEETGGMLRDALSYHAAHTGRWSSMGVQLHNVKSRGGRPPEKWATGERDLVWDAKACPLDLLVDATNTLAIMTRETILARDVATVADLSQIEARAVLWLAGVDDALEDFAPGKDPYLAMAESLGVPGKRDFGKIVVLACGYGMGPVKFAVQAAEVGVKLGHEGIPTAEETIELFRAARARLVQWWHALEYAFHAATDLVPRPPAWKQGPLGRVDVHPGPFSRSVAITLPSGSTILYRDPRWAVFDEDEDRWVVLEEKTADAQVTALVMRGKSWARTSIYGGKLAENTTQKVSRDFLAHGYVGLMRAGYMVSLHVHDEVFVETDRRDDVLRIFTTPPDWAPGFPLAAEGFLSPCWRKKPPAGVEEVKFQGGVKVCK